MSDPVPWSDLSGHMRANRALETSIIDRSEKSVRIAWRVAGASLVLAAIGLSAGAYGVFKHEEPQFVFIPFNSATGAVDVVTVLDGKHQLPPSKARDLHWLNKYVLSCEGYDWNTIQLQYDTCALLSAPDVQREYVKKYSGAEALDKVLRDRVSIRVSVNSIQTNESGQAFVRFSTTRADKSGKEDAPEYRAATIGYKNEIDAKMSYEDRLKNPFGFQVTSYIVSPDKK